MITLDEIKLYLRVDSEYEDDYIKFLVDTSETYIDSMVGTKYKEAIINFPLEEFATERLVKLLQKKLIADMYTNRGTEIPANTKKDIIAVSILDKLSNY